MTPARHVHLNGTTAAVLRGQRIGAGACMVRDVVAATVVKGEYARWSIDEPHDAILVNGPAQDGLLNHLGRMLMPTIQPVRRGTMAVAAALSVLITAVVALMLPPTRASADAFAGCYGPSNAQGCLPDDFEHTFCYSGIVNQNLRDSFTPAMNRLGSLTSYNVQLLEKCDNLTDVIVIQDVTLTAYGVYQCIIRNAANNCERGHIRLNPNNLTAANDRTKTSCHEIGHSVGLKHGINTGPAAGQDNNRYLFCMNSGAAGTEDIDEYGDHHLMHINARS